MMNLDGLLMGSRSVASRGDLFVIILVLCFVIAALVTANVWQYRDGRKCQDARIADAMATIPVLTAANNAMSDITKEMASRTNMAGALGETVRAIFAAQEKLAERLEKLTNLVRDSMQWGRP